MLNPERIRAAHTRIAPHIVNTPLLQSDVLNELMGGVVVFKYEGFQKTGSFKVRGALNALLSLREQQLLPPHVVAFSSGNHAQALAYAARLVGIRATIFIPETASPFKINATLAQGAQVILTASRDEAEARSAEYVTAGAMLIPPFDHDFIIAGQGTSCYEALSTGFMPDAIFATVGGGGWISGTYLAAKLLCPNAKIIGAEPALANDAAISYRTGSIHRLATAPNTIADGARTPALAARTFAYVRQLDGMIEIDEATIIEWTRTLALQLKITAEPTSCVSAAACAQWFSQPGNTGKTALVLLSGGNIDPATHQHIWSA
ncbi:MAG: serine/threonine dehydratase [Rickettsiales bacterium]